MKITLFSSNQPRHLALAHKLSKVCDQVNFVIEANTVFPGKKRDFFQATPVMDQYFSNVRQAEENIFGPPSFTTSRVSTLVIKSGDLSGIPRAVLEDCLTADRFIVFGASYIRGWLVDELVKRSAVNIHMGLSPYYRGSSCNFWALYDNKPQYVGATIHLLSHGLDSGDMLKHVRPVYSGETPFEFTMRAVESAQDYLVRAIDSGDIDKLTPLKQNPKMALRYSINKDFNDDVAKEYLSRPFSPEQFRHQLEAKEDPTLR